MNYDMPWNPMRVEQRIGRIDRLGQRNETIRIGNLHYADTIEADVYAALRHRIGLFSKFVGKLQPILAALPRSISSAVLGAGDKAQRAGIVSDLDEPPRAAALYDLDALDALIRRPELLPTRLRRGAAR